MKFLYPTFLWALFALIVPVIIHLFNFRKAKKIYFSNTAMLRKVNEASTAKRKIKHYLILMSRMLFLAFLVLAFAQPFLIGENQRQGNGEVVIYLDNSFSMTSYHAEGLRAIDLAAGYIDQISNAYPTNTRYALITNDFDSRSFGGMKKDELKEYVTEIKVSPNSMSMDKVYEAMEKMMAQSPQAKDVFLVSDFQKSVHETIVPSQPDTINRYTLSPVSLESTENIYIDSVYLERPFLSAEGKNNQLNVILKNTGSSTKNDVLVRFFINQIQAASASVTVEGGKLAEISFDISTSLENFNSCRISIEDYPTVFDNDFYFIMAQSQQVSILEIHAENAPQEIGKVFENEALFRLDRQNVNNVDYEKLSRSDLVVLNELNTLSEALLNRLESYIQSGGDLLIIPSSTALDQLSALVPGYQGIDEPDAEKTDIAPPDLDNPFFENIFESATDRIDMPAARSVVSWGGLRQTLLSLRNGQPFLSRFSNATGNVYALSSPLRADYTNFQRHAIFVPTMYKIALQSKTQFQNLYYRIDEPNGFLTLDSISDQQLVKIQPVDQDEEIIPIQQFVNDQVYFELPPFSVSPGFYKVLLNDNEVALIAFNHNKIESDLKQYSIQELNEAFALQENVTIFEPEARASVANEIKESRFGISLWQYALIVALFFLLAEILIIRFIK